MAFGKQFDDDEEVMNNINMTPLVDVMLVLLIIFIIGMPLLTHSVKIDLPRASNTPNEITPEIVSVSVKVSGQVYWNNKEITEASLIQKLQKAAQQHPQPEIHLRGDRLVNYEHMIKVMTAAQRAGILKLGFITEPVN